MTPLARSTVAVLAVVTLCAGCAQSPVLYPNAKVEDLGRAEVAGDVAYCRELANERVSSGGATAKEIGKDTAVGAVGGAGLGAVAGAASGGGAGRGRPLPLHHGLPGHRLAIALSFVVMRP